MKKNAKSVEFSICNLNVKVVRCIAVLVIDVEGYGRFKVRLLGIELG